MSLIHSGLYYSWASPRHGWVDNEIPQCIHQVRKLISRLVSNYGDKDPGDGSFLAETLNDELPIDPQPSTSSHDSKGEDATAGEKIITNHVVALAWTASGSRRVSRLDDTPCVTPPPFTQIPDLHCFLRVLSSPQRISPCSCCALVLMWNSNWSGASPILRNPPRP